MPEGDTVLVAATRLHQALAGRRLLATDFRACLRHRRPQRADPRARRRAGQAPADAHGRGTTIHSHLRMDGEWQLHAPDRRRGPAHEVRVVLTT
jgi:endonuclease-8